MVLLVILRRVYSQANLNHFDNYMRFIYTLLWYLLTPFILFRLYWKGRKLPAYRQRIAERFSLTQKHLSPADVWLHAVSLGEAIAATPLIDAMLAQSWRVVVTTMTPTGSAHIQKRFGGQVSHQYVPYDLPFALRRFFAAVQVKVGVIMETELWPNLILEAGRRQLPLMVANARISDKAFPQYQKIQFFLKPFLKQMRMIGAQSALDATRYKALGANPQCVTVLGNMKFDLKIPEQLPTIGSELKIAVGNDRPLLIVASTHPGEEALFLDKLSLLKNKIPGLMLWIAPRHPERFQSIVELCCQYGLKTGRRSDFSTINVQNDVVVLDSLGELLSFYQVSDFAFVGGSLVPIGGHNVLEPIALRVPVFCGPYMQNAQSICDNLVAARALQYHAHIDAIVDAIVAMYQQPAQRKAQVQQATQVLEANQGAVFKHLQHINALWEQTH